MAKKQDEQSKFMQHQQQVAAGNQTDDKQEPDAKNTKNNNKSIKKAGNTSRNPGKATVNKALNNTKVGQNVQRAKRAAKATKKAIRRLHGFAHVIVIASTNPITWIAFGAVLVMLAVSSGLSTMGPSDYGTNCATTSDIEDADSGGGKSSGADDAWEHKGTKEYENAKKVWDSWKSHGFGGAAIAGIIGNIAHEGGFSVLDRAEGHFGSDEKSNGVSAGVTPISSIPGRYSVAGAGIYQFTPYTKFAPLGDKKWLDMQAQTDFVWNSEIKPGLSKTTVSPVGLGSGGKVWTTGGYKAYAHVSDPGDAAKYWLCMYERGEWNPAKVGSAEKAYKIFGGDSVKADDSKLGKSSGGSNASGDSGESGDTTNCVNSDDPAATSDILKFAEDIAWPEKDQAKGETTGGLGGKDKATPKYIAAKEKAMKVVNDGMHDLYNSCDRFVATVVKNTVDAKFPWGPTTAQQEYMRKSDDWKAIDCSDIKPGDVIIGEESPGGGAQHIMIYMNKDHLVSASLGQRTGTIHQSGTHGCSGKYLHGNVDGHQYGEIFRHSGKANPIK